MVLTESGKEDKVEESVWVEECRALGTEASKSSGASDSLRGHYH